VLDATTKVCGVTHAAPSRRDHPLGAICAAKFRSAISRDAALDGPRAGSPS
jgi:hypothetical protein